MNKLVFSKLTKEQISRFPVIQGVQVDPVCLLAEEPNLANVLNMLTSKEMSKEDVSRAAGMYKQLSESARIAAISSFMQHMQRKPGFIERFKQIHGSIIPMLVEVFQPRVSRNLERVWSQQQNATTLTWGKYFSSRVLMTTGLRTPVLKPGSSFKLLSETALEHGTVDATVDSAVHGELKVIFAPHEVQEVR